MWQTLQQQGYKMQIPSTQPFTDEEHKLFLKAIKDINEERYHPGHQGICYWYNN